MSAYVKSGGLWKPASSIHARNSGVWKTADGWVRQSGVWKPFTETPPSGITFIGASTGVNSATIPAHEAGDLILIFCFRDGSTSSITTPSGYTPVVQRVGNSSRADLFRKIAASSSESFSAISGVTGLIVHVYRNVDPTTPIGKSGSYVGSSPVLYYAGGTFNVTDGTSGAAFFAGHRSTNTSLETAPSGAVNRSNFVNATNEVAGHDALGVTGWDHTTTSVDVGGTTSDFVTIGCELLAAA